MIRIFFFCFLFLLAPMAYSGADGSNGKTWALYSWIDESGQWNYSLIRGTERHPDGAEVKEAATTSLERIKTRIGLLEKGSSVEINPLPVLNLELHLPPSNTIKELDRVCTGSQLKLISSP